MITFTKSMIQYITVKKKALSDIITEIRNQVQGFWQVVIFGEIGASSAWCLPAVWEDGCKVSGESSRQNE